MTQPPFDESRYLPIPGERPYVVKIFAGVTVVVFVLSVGLLLLLAGTESFALMLPVLIVVNVADLAVLGWEVLRRRNYLRDRAAGRVIDRLPGRPDGQGDHQGPNLAE